MKSKILILTVISAVVVSAYAGSAFLATKALAQNSTQMTDLVQKIANKFGLNKDEVQTIFNEHHQIMMEERLAVLVSEGKITEAQKQLIAAKRKELREKHQAEMQSVKDLNYEERKALMNQHRQELENWANQNGIDVQYIIGFGGREMGRGYKGM